MRPDSPERGSSRAAAPARVAAGTATVLRPDERAAVAEAPREGDLELQLRYWRARSAELEAQLEAAQARLLALAEHLPVSLAPALAEDPEALARGVAASDVLEGWEETILLKPSSVASEMPRLWAKLRRQHP